MSTTTPPSSSSPKKQHIVSNLQPIQLSKSSSLSSPRFPPLPGATTPTGSSGSCIRRIGIGVDLSDESAYAVKWAVENYLRPGDAVILLHVRSTSILYGADWGSSTPTTATSSASSSGAGCNPFSSSSSTSPHKSASSPPPPPPPQQQAVHQQSDATLKEDAESENFTAAKSMSHLAQPLMGARVPFKIHVVKDHDMKERLCLEVERLGLSALVMGSRGIGRNRTTSNKKGMVGSVSDYCVQHCACPVIVVRYNNNNNVFSNNDNYNNNNNNNYYNSNNNHTHTHAPVENNSNNSSGQLELRDEAGDQRN